MSENTTIVPFAAPTDFQALAVEKLNKELEAFNGGSKEKAVSKFVASTLTHFCEQDRRFAEVVYKTKRTLSDCCSEVMSGCGNHISDIDVYRSAVRAYFPNADIEFNMKITINGDQPTEEELSRLPEKKASSRQQRNPAVTPRASAPSRQPAASSVPIKPAAPSKPAAPLKEKKPEVIQISLF